jgi:cellobiose phosphorylase
MNTYDILKPWVGYNYHFTDQTYLRVNPRMQGPFWIREPQIRMVHSGTRLVYLWDQHTGESWNPNTTHLPTLPDSNTWVPNESSTCLTSKTSHIQTEWTIVTHHQGPAELWKLTITNLYSRPRSLGVSLALPLSEGGHMGSRTTWNPQESWFTNWSFPLHGDYHDYERLNTLPHNLLGYLWPQPEAVSTSTRHFYQDQPLGTLPGFVQANLGNNNSKHNSQHNSGSLYSGFPYSGFPHSLPENSAEPGIFAALYSFTLEPSESWTCFFTISLAQEPTLDPSLRISSIQDWNRNLTAYKDWYHRVSGNLELQSPDSRINTMVTTWLRKEIVWEARLWRNGVTTPWRNELQDALGYSVYNPEQALLYLEAVTKIQEPTGYLKVWNTREGEKPNHPLAQKRHTDGGIWLVISWVMAMRMTGHFEWWDQIYPYADGTKGPLVDHLARALDFSYQDRGAHGLVLFHDGDWADPFNGPGHQGRGESGWATQGLIFAMNQFASLADTLNYNDLAKKYSSRAQELLDALDLHLWTGTRYSYGFDDQGNRFGDDSDGRTYLNTQSWGLLANPDTAHGQELVKTLDTLGTPYGPRLTHPCFQGWDPQAGRISLKVPGTTENGSVYCHGSLFAAYGLAQAGYGDKALDILSRTIPGHPDHRQDIPHQLPIYQPNSYFCFPGHPQDGLSTGTLGTGTCTWIVLLIFEQFLGLSFSPQGLMVNPNLPTDWPKAELTFTRRSTEFRVRMSRTTGAGQVVEPSGQQIQDENPQVHHPVTSIWVNGVTHAGGPIPWQGKSTMDVEVWL